MPDETLVRHCSPTLAGLKTGSLFTARFATREELYAEMRRLNRRLSGRGVQILPVRYRGETALLYLYRPARLQRDLSCAEAREILEGLGYAAASPGRCLARLVQKFGEAECFPHEVGLFLSYPPEDVRGFMENRAANYKCVGCWKVYGDTEQAQKTFRRYEKCTRVYCEQHAKGKPMEQLIVAVGQ